MPGFLLPCFLGLVQLPGFTEPFHHDFRSLLGTLTPGNQKRTLSVSRIPLALQVPELARTGVPEIVQEVQGIPDAVHPVAVENRVQTLPVWAVLGPFLFPRLAYESDGPFRLVGLTAYCDVVQWLEPDFRVYPVVQGRATNLLVLGTVWSRIRILADLRKGDDEGSGFGGIGKIYPERFRVTCRRAHLRRVGSLEPHLPATTTKNKIQHRVPRREVDGRPGGLRRLPFHDALSGFGSLGRGHYLLSTQRSKISHLRHSRLFSSTLVTP